MRKESDAPAVRTFIAIPVSTDVKSAVSGLADSLKDGLTTEAKWVTPENYHLTMVFTGSVQEDRIPDIEDIIRNVRAKNFQIAFGGIGIFPSSAKAKVLWVGMQSGVENCSWIAAELLSGLKKKGFEVDGKPFSGHLTLARFRQPSKIDISVLDTKTQIPVMQAEKVYLYKSVLKPSGPVYSEIFSAKLEE